MRGRIAEEIARGIVGGGHQIAECLRVALLQRLHSVEHALVLEDDVPAAVALLLKATNVKNIN